ncbi:MAG: ArsC/Spx/MgsR family protein [Burkholderiaceae bacterium]
MASPTATPEKARAWLKERSIDHVFHDFKKQGVPEAELGAWLKVVGWETLVNRKGTTWRKLTEMERNSVTDDASARALALTQASVIKRPVVQWDNGDISVGFDPVAWAKRLES